MEKITDDILIEFQRLSSYDISEFFSQYVEFTERHYSAISNYFSGHSDIAPADSFDRLNWLVREQKKIIDVVILNSPSLNNYKFWVLLEYVEEIGHALETAKNASKWLRSSITNDGYKQQVVTDYMLSQGQTLEDVESRVLQSSNPRDSWVSTALENGLAEDDYDMEGGQLISVIYKNNASIFLSGIVDNINEPLKTFGKDISRNVTFEDDDLICLGYKDTLIQCAEILSGLKRGDDPSFADRGVDYKTILGGSFAAVSYPAIFRDLARSFATDDSFKAFSIKDVRRERDQIMLDFEVQTKTGEVFSLASEL